VAIKWQNILLQIVSYTAVIGLVLLNAKNSFFWDTVQLASAHANYYYSKNFSELFLPIDIDSGHIPAFGMYIALVWKLFGRTLEVSHLAMLPFAIGIVWQLYKICVKFIPQQYTGIALLLILADPSLLSQITLVSPDVALIFFLFLAFNAILDNKRWILSIGIFLLFMTSMRGMMVSFCLLLLDIYCNTNFKTSKKGIVQHLLKRSLIYLPAMLLFILFNGYHYIVKGWIGYHKDSPWANCFEPIESVKDFFFNVGLYGWRLLDFGRIIIWLILFLLILIYKKPIFKTRNNILLCFFCLTLMLFLPLNMLWAKNLMGHRYFLPVYLMVALFCSTILFSDFVSQRIKYPLATIWLVVLISGNLWIYPPKVAQGWDSTLAHLNYYQLRANAMEYISSKNIDSKDVQSFFPNTATFDRIDLNNDFRNFDNFDGTSAYIMHSNVYNVNDEDYIKISNTYDIEKRFENRGVVIDILKKRNKK